MNIFEIASRNKLRFPSTVGDLTTEQLWELPLESPKGPSLDNVARAVNGALKAVTEESFVSPASNPGKLDLTIKLDILKAIIATRQAENAARLASADRADKRRKILDAIAAKEDQALTTASKEDLLKQLAELDG